MPKFYPGTDVPMDLWLNAHPPSQGFFERNSFTKTQLKSALIEILCGDEMHASDVEALVAICAAVDDFHPHMKISVDLLDEGQRPAKLLQAQARSRAWRVADQIDIAVANGVKQDAAVKQAQDENSISRREVFRALRFVRAERLLDRETEQGHSDIEFEPRYPGYSIDNHGKLVPTDMD